MLSVVLRIPRAVGVAWLSAVALGGATSWVVLRHAAHEPYAVLTPSGLYEQVVGATVLVVLWLELLVVVVVVLLRTHVRRGSLLALLLLGSLSIYYLTASIGSYIFDIVQNRPGGGWTRASTAANPPSDRALRATREQMFWNREFQNSQRGLIWP